MGARHQRPGSGLDPLQSEAVSRALATDGFGFFPEPRVGKTRMSMVLANELGYPQVLIICPKSVFHVWRKAIKEEGRSPFVEYRLTNYEQLVSRKRRKQQRAWLKSAPSMVILDEGHRIKRRGSKQSRACRTFARVAKYRLLLTGTPMAQGIQDTWALFDFIQPGLFSTYENFQSRYLVMGGYQARKVVGTKRLAEFSRILHEHSARIRLKEVSDKPLMIRRVKRLLELEPIAQQHYDELERELITATQKIVVETPLVISLTLRLQQICGGFLSDGEQSENVSRVKLQAAESHIIHPEPLVICCRYINEIEALQEICRKQKVLCRVVRGGQPLEEPFIDGVLIVQIQSGLGIDLSASKRILWYSWNYSYIDYEQMRFRILSRKQTRVDYIFLMIKNSVDELIYQSVTQKRKLSDLVCDHYRSKI